jgi:hypothetical protein
VTDPDELIQLLAQLMEDASDALAVERALAGAAADVRIAAADAGVTPTYVLGTSKLAEAARRLPAR